MVTPFYSNTLDRYPVTSYSDRYQARTGLRPFRGTSAVRTGTGKQGEEPFFFWQTEWEVGGGQMMVIKFEQK